MHSHPSHFPSFSWGWGTTNFLPSSLPPERRVSITSSRERCSDRTTCSKARPCSCRWSTKTVLPWRSIARSSGRRKQTRTGSLSASMKIMASLPEDRDPAAQPLPEGVLLGLPLLVPAHLVEAGGGGAAARAAAGRRWRAPARPWRRCAAGSRRSGRGRRGAGCSRYATVLPQGPPVALGVARGLVGAGAQPAADRRRRVGV